MNIPENDSKKRFVSEIQKRIEDKLKDRRTTIEKIAKTYGIDKKIFEGLKESSLTKSNLPTPKTKRPKTIAKKPIKPKTPTAKYRVGQYVINKADTKTPYGTYKIISKKYLTENEITDTIGWHYELEGWGSIMLSEQDLQSTKTTNKAANPKKPTKPKTPTSQINQARKTAKKVRAINPVVGFARRFAAFHNKEVTKLIIGRLAKAIEKAVIDHTVRKGDKHAALVKYMQTALEKILSANGKSVFVEITPSRIVELVTVGGGEEQYPSIRLMKRFVGLMEKDVLTKEEVERFLNAVEKALKDSEVQANDPYYSELQNIKSKFKGGKVSIENHELSGIDEILHGCGCYAEPVGKSEGLEGIDTITTSSPSTSIHGLPLAPIMNTNFSKNTSQVTQTSIGNNENPVTNDYNRNLIAVMPDKEPEFIQQSEYFQQLLPQLEKQHAILFYGKQGSGKTTFLMDLLKDRIANNYKCAYISSEQIRMNQETGEYVITSTLRNLMGRKRISNHDVDFYGVIPPNINDYDIVFIDSIQSAGLNEEGVANLIKSSLNQGFVFVSKSTKDGTFRGGNDLAHDIDIEMFINIVEDESIVNCGKNRFSRDSEQVNVRFEIE